MTKITASAWIPLSRPPAVFPERLADYCEAKEAFIREAPPCLCTLSSAISDVGVTLEEPPKKIRAQLKSRRGAHKFSNKESDMVSIEAEVDVDVDSLRLLNPDRIIDDPFLHACASIYLHVAVEQLLILSEISYPSCINTFEGVALTPDSGTYEIAAKHSFYALRYDILGDSVWPALRQVTLEQTIKWVARTSFLSNPIAHTRVERALASYTHVISLTQDRTGEVLFRSMQGLEAFYCEGAAGLRQQLAEKSAIWLGPWTDRSNIVGKLYDLRSKFVHGTGLLDYSPGHLDSGDVDEKGNYQFDDTFDNAAKFAFRILVATLQRCVSESVLDVRWQQSVEIVG